MASPTSPVLVDTYGRISSDGLEVTSENREQARDHREDLGIYAYGQVAQCLCRFDVCLTADSPG